MWPTLALIAWLISNGVQCGDIETHVPKISCTYFSDKDVVGKYDPSSNTVKLSCDDKMVEVYLLHELTHACQSRSGRGYLFATCYGLVEAEIEAYGMMQKYTLEKYGNSTMTEEWLTQTLSDTYVECMEDK